MQSFRLGVLASRELETDASYFDEFLPAAHQFALHSSSRTSFTPRSSQSLQQHCSSSLRHRSGAACSMTQSLLPLLGAAAGAMVQVLIIATVGYICAKRPKGEPLLTPDALKVISRVANDVFLHALTFPTFRGRKAINPRYCDSMK